MTDTKRSVLLVDDDKFLLDMYAMKFTQDGYNVQACLSVSDALSALQGGFVANAILFDITMPEQDGFALLSKLRSEHLAEGAIKIALSNQSDDSEREKAISLGADHYIVKASKLPSEVVDTVGKFIREKNES